jgi:hypothetical protein
MGSEGRREERDYKTKSSAAKRFKKREQLLLETTDSRLSSPTGLSLARPNPAWLASFTALVSLCTYNSENTDSKDKYKWTVYIRRVQEYVRRYSLDSVRIRNGQFLLFSNRSVGGW